MLVLFRKALFILILNSTLFLLLIIGIQNSENKSKVKLIVGETVSLPISFIVGMSFITGSISGSILTMNFRGRRNN
tara:strand:+ start:1009 stop:1236 length:228 start_codon:yes stop_codon:yes gene_type:complete